MPRPRMEGVVKVCDEMKLGEVKFDLTKYLRKQ